MICPRPTCLSLFRVYCVFLAVEGEEDVRVRAVETRGRDSQEEDESKKDSPLCWGTTLLSFSCSSLSLPLTLPLSLSFSLSLLVSHLCVARVHTCLFVISRCLRFSLYTHCTCTCVSVLIGIHVYMYCWDWLYCVLI